MKWSPPFLQNIEIALFLRNVFSDRQRTMSGMIPGVGVGPRRRSTQIRHKDHPKCSEYFRNRPDPPSMAVNSMHETALRARQRLEEKLGNFISLPRPGKIQSRSERRNNNKDGSRILGRSWNLGIGRWKSDRKMCAVCLDDIGGDDEEQVMDLSCSHKYHSRCLLPWIATNPHCPCCRTPIPSESSSFG